MEKNISKIINEEINKFLISEGLGSALKNFGKSQFVKSVGNIISPGLGDDINNFSEGKFKKVNSKGGKITAWAANNKFMVNSIIPKDFGQIHDLTLDYCKKQKIENRTAMTLFENYLICCQQKQWPVNNGTYGYFLSQNTI